ncbi:suppressor of fused domain protein [Paraburkholderia sp. J94]|uniref:suppressor of fused domain protein n=1 Tax=Paraburkholderia sp. J94 TaxID=2805441 RepID=UPI002AB00F70|nr:suppressor of fused domain protein [Paraburkholderia sp. J94]
MELIDHLERHLGPIRDGWKDQNSHHGITIARFADTPYEGASTYSTLGLSRDVAPLSDGRPCAQELLFAARDEYPAGQIASFLLTFAESLHGRKQALERGDVVGPGLPLVSDVRANSVYAAIPVIFPDELATFSNQQRQKVVVAWLIPLVPNEAEFVRSVGWNKFEDLLEAANPDLLDLNRASIV